MNNVDITTPHAHARRGLLLSGIALAILGVVAFAVQIALKHLGLPWYLPLASTAGFAMVVFALVKVRNLWRTLAAVLMLGMTILSWGIIFGARAPAYTGPVEVGKPIPVFSTLKADGSPFTQLDLVGAKSSVLVFFRGRW